MPRPSPTTLGQGLATWLVYLVLSRITRPIRWAFRQVRGVLFHWTEYSRYIREQTVVEGLFNGSKLWLAIGGLVWGARALRRATGHTERIVLREVLGPGERMVITQVPRKVPRKQRRAAAKAG